MKTLLALSIATLSATALSQVEERSAGRQALEGLVASARDPRLEGLPAGPGGVPVGGPIHTLASQDERFAAGLALFDRPFHRSRGVGAPGMNGDSCRACHQDPTIAGAGGLELNVSRFGDDGGGTLPFQNLPGGQGLSKLYPPFTAGREEYDPTTATVFEQRQTPSLLGAGLLDSIPEEVIVANEDPDDANGDGIYGVARRVVVNGVEEIGRFGWKAQVPRLRDFIMDAMGGELGITTPDDGRGFALLTDADAVLDPELTLPEVDLLDHFLSNLPAPLRRASDRLEVHRGEAVFSTIGCAVCHVPALAGPEGPVPAYTDLLLHDVMPAGFRGMAEPGAAVGLYRTPPLWGVSATAPYLHDGRAEDLEHAILSHEGEAAGVIQRYHALSAAQQDALILFLEHL